MSRSDSARTSDHGGTVVNVAPQSGKAIAVEAGALIRITDVAGSQIGDLFVLDPHDPAEFLSASHTRSITKRLFPRVGESFWTNRRRRALTLLMDSSPGHHDMLFPPCSPLMFAEAGLPPQPSCEENFALALARVGRSAAPPPPVNLFQRTPVRRSGRLVVRRATSRPGDAVVLRAECDLLMVLTACAIGYGTANGGHCTGLRLEVEGWPAFEDLGQFSA